MASWARGAAGRSSQSRASRACRRSSRGRAWRARRPQRPTWIGCASCAPTVCGRASGGGAASAAALPRGGGDLEVAQVERRVEVHRLRLLEEPRVDAVEWLAVAVVRALDGGAALGKRQAGHLDPAEPVAGALGALEGVHVDLGLEHLVHTAHEAVAGLLVVEQVEVLATR